MQTELEKRLRNGRTGKNVHSKKAHRERERRRERASEREVEQQAALRIKEKLKTRKVTTTKATTTTKTRLHEPLFMPLMNANKLKWLKKETKTYAHKNIHERHCVCPRYKMNISVQESSNSNSNSKQSQIKKMQARKSNRIKYLNKYSLLGLRNKTYQPLI